MKSTSEAIYFIDDRRMISSRRFILNVISISHDKNFAPFAAFAREKFSRKGSKENICRNFSLSLSYLFLFFSNDQEILCSLVRTMQATKQRSVGTKREGDGRKKRKGRKRYVDQTKKQSKLKDEGDVDYEELPWVVGCWLMVVGQ